MLRNTNIHPFLHPMTRGNLQATLDLVARAADSICDGELVEKKIRSMSRWELLPLQVHSNNTKTSSHAFLMISSDINVMSS